MSRDRCAGDVIIIEVNRPPTHDKNDVVATSPKSRNDVSGEPAGAELPSCVERADCDGDKQDSSGRRRDDEVVYVEIDVDCGTAGRRNIISPSSKYAAAFIGYVICVRQNLIR